jgi:glutamyl aminopeptidase
MIAFPELIKFQRESWEKAKVKYQYYISPGGTDAEQIHKNYDGIPTLTHCLVSRNIHTCSSILDSYDYYCAKKSLLYMLKHLDGDILKSLSRGK